MAEKRKPNSAGERPVESDRQFLDQANIKSLMKDVVCQLSANRPDDPLSFIASYFECLEDKSNLVTKAYQQITLTPHDRPAFPRNLKVAYNLLSQHKVFRDFELFGGVTVKKSLKGVSGSVYADLLIMLTKEIPSVIVNKLMKKIECMEYEAVTFNHFQSCVFTCCVLKDYVKQTEQLFSTLDVQKQDKVDKALSKVVLDQLSLAVDQSESQDSLSVLQAGYDLGPEGLYKAIDKAYCQDSKRLGTVTCEEFVNSACDTFLSKIKSLR